MIKYKNIYTERNLSRLMQPHDSRRYKHSIKKDRDYLLENAISMMLSENINFSEGVFSSKVNGKSCKSIKDYSTVLLLRAINDYLQKFFEVKSSSREKIIRGVIEALCDSTPMFIIKKDISSFYESINVDNLKSIILEQNLFPLHTRLLLKKFFSVLCGNSYGIPRGLGLSAILSEIALLDFDKKVKSIDGVYRYFRYVDDIVIFCLSDPEKIK